MWLFFWFAKLWSDICFKIERCGFQKVCLPDFACNYFPFFLTIFQNMRSGTKLTAKDATDTKPPANSTSRRPEPNGDQWRTSQTRTRPKILGKPTWFCLPEEYLCGSVIVVHQNPRPPKLLRAIMESGEVKGLLVVTSMVMFHKLLYCTLADSQVYPIFVADLFKYFWFLRSPDQGPP